MVEDKPPRVPTDSGKTDVRSDDHIPEEQPATNKRLVPLPRWSLHDIVVRRVKAQRSSREAVRHQVDPEKLHGDKSLRHSKRGRQEDRDDFTNVGRDEVPDELLRVVVDAAAFLNRRLDRGKVVVGQNHVCRQLGDVSTSAHRDTNVTLLQGRGVVDTVTSHGHHLSGRLQKIDKLRFMAGLSAGEQGGVFGGLELVAVTQVIELTAGKALPLEILVLAEDADLSADGLCGVLVVSGNDHNADTCLPALLDALGHLWARGVEHTDQTKKRHALFKLLVLLSGFGFAREVGINIVDARKRHDT